MQAPTHMRRAAGCCAVSDSSNPSTPSSTACYQLCPWPCHPVTVMLQQCTLYYGFVYRAVWYSC